ncbi:MAG: HD domain-containing protein [Gemmatimonadota bacterium]
MSSSLHPLIRGAAETGALPAWARCGPERLEHARAVAGLLDGWAVELGLEEERGRWRAAGILHDALKDADAEELRGLAGAEWPDPVLHAPACAARLAQDGVTDGELLQAISYHSIGHPDFGLLGDCLYLADYLEPGRDGLSAGREELRSRLPGGREEVLGTVIGLRIRRLLDTRRRILPESILYWNRVTAR